jgi:hypothetical protein
MPLDAATAPDQLERLMRRARAAAVGFGVLGLCLRLATAPSVVKDLSIPAFLVSIAVPFGGYLLLFRRTRPAATFLVRGDRFVAPASVHRGYYVIMLFFLAGGLWRIERAPDGSIDAPIMSGWLVASVLMALLVSGLAAWLLVPGPAVILHPDRLVIRMFRAESIPWTSLAPGGPPDPPAKVWDMGLLTTSPPRWVMVNLRWLAVDKTFLAGAIRHYVAHPEHRPAIGTAEELAHLRGDLG